MSYKSLSGPQSSAIYIHVPFCRRRCAYCHFDIKVPHPRSDFTAMRRRYVAALLDELHWYARQPWAANEVGSIFFGGGTPSLLQPDELQEITTAIARVFHLAGACEISMELNPEDAEPAKLRAYQQAGVNRMSFGVQSFDNTILRAIGRLHDGRTAELALNACPSLDFGRSLDLILGLPHQDRASLARDVARVLALAPEHLSLYMLERDLPTPLDKRALPMPNEDEQADAYEWLAGLLIGKGYAHYEISNFARPGYRSRHNLTYWQCGDYLGLGPAACGRVGTRFWRNAARIQDWQAAVAEQGHGMVFQEIWSAERFRQERLIQGLRLSDGVPIGAMTQEERNQIEALAQIGLCRLDRSRCCLTLKGRLLANEVFAVFTH